LEACREERSHFLIRLAQDRRIYAADGTVLSLLAAVRALPPQDQRDLYVPAHHHQPARTAHLSISFRAATLRPPAQGRRKAPLAVWLVRVWEADPPPEVDEPLEWIVLTSVPTLTVTDAWARAEWYTCRPLVEDYHQCLKTGCSLEQRHLQSYDSVGPAAGVLGAESGAAAPVARTGAAGR
jgi:hypothetical protein